MPNSLNVTHVPVAGQRHYAPTTAGASNSRLINVGGGHLGRGGDTNSSPKPTANEETLGTRANNVSAKTSPVLTRPRFPTTPMNKAQEALSTPRSYDSRHHTITNSTPQTGTTISSVAGPSNSSSSRLYQQDVDRDYLFALSLQQELNGTAEGSVSNLPDQAPVYPSAEPIDLTDDSDDDDESFPFDETYRAQLGEIMAKYPQDADSYLLFPSGPNVLSARCRTCNFSVDLPATGSLTTSFDTITDGMQNYEVRRFVGFRLMCHSEFLP